MPTLTTPEAPTLFPLSPPKPCPWTDRRPYRLCVFARQTVIRTHRRRVRHEQQSYGYVAWNPDHTVSLGRLPGAGAFVWIGKTAAVREALRTFATDPRVHQVQLRTEQDRTLFVWHRHADNRVSGYRAEED